MQRQARRTVRRFGEKQQRRTMELAPYDASHPAEDFHLRDNVRLRFSDDGLVYEVGFLESDFIDEGLPFYAIFTEHGTRFMKARPCVFPARDEVYPEFRSALRTDIRASLKRMRRRRSA